MQSHYQRTGVEYIADGDMAQKTKG